MKKFTYTITDPVGIHARPAGMLVNEVKACGAQVTISCNGKSADAGKLMALMGLGIKNGMEVEVTVEGEQEETAFAQLKEFFVKNL